MVTDEPAGPATVVPALAALPHQVEGVPYGHVEAVAVADCLLLDGTTDLTAMVAACRSPELHALEAAILLVTPMHSLAVLKVTWGFDDWLLPECGANELAARLRLATAGLSATTGSEVTTGLEIDPASFSVRASGRELNLTFTEFELLRALVSTPHQVWTRAGLLRDVWGYQHLAGTRTVDVHVRRLRAKLGPEFAASIQTVRKVGYKFVPKPRAVAA